MGVKVHLSPMMDGGTGNAKQLEGPVTFSEPLGTEPTNNAKQQPAEVTYEDLTHEGESTGVAKQASEPVTYRDELAEGLEEKARREAATKAKKREAAEDKAVRPESDAETKSTRKKRSR